MSYPTNGTTPHTQQVAPLLLSESIERSPGRTSLQPLESQSADLWQDWVLLAAHLCQTPIATLSFFNGDRQVFSATYGWQVESLDQRLSLEMQVLTSTDFWIVSDLSEAGTSEELPSAIAQHPLLQREPAVRFWAAVSLMTPQGDRLGALSVMDYVPRDFSQNQIQGLQALARQVMQQWNLQDHQSHLEQVQAQLQQVSLEQASVCEHLPDGLMTLDPHGRILALNAQAEHLLHCDRQMLIGQEFGQAFPELEPSQFLQECFRAIEQHIEVQFELFYPSLGLVLETVVVPHDQGLWVYLRDVTAQTQATASLREHDRLTALSHAIHAALEQGGALPHLLHQCVQAIVANLNEVMVARIWMFNSESGLLELQAIAGEIPAPNDLPPLISLGISLVGLIAQNRQSYLSNDLSHDICFSAKDWAKQEGLVGFAGYPLVVEDRLLGVLVVLSHQVIQSTTDESFQDIAKGLAIAMDRSLARAELVSRRESLLFQLASQIRNSLNLDNHLSKAVQEIRQRLQIDRCNFLWCLSKEDPTDPKKLLQLTLIITHESKQEELPSLLGEYAPEVGNPLAKKILNLELLRIEDVHRQSQLDPELRQLVISWGAISQLMMPMETRSGQLGAIVCSHSHATRIWSDAEVELLRAVTDQLAIAIDQAELYAQTRAAAFAAQAQAHQLSEALKNLRQTQAQLIQSEKMSSLGQLVAGIAHEINNPVGFVSGNLIHASTYVEDLFTLLHLYQKHYPKPDPEIQHCIKEIELDFIVEDLQNLLQSMKIGTERICKIVLSLRNFSRLDEAEVKAVDIHEGIDNTLLILQNRLKPHGSCPGISITKHYGNLPLVQCYASQLNQVFMNILCNAIDALEHQPNPCITITTEVWDGEMFSEPGRTQVPWVVIRFQDNGLGMSDEVRQKIFDPFFTTKPVGQGTGLGLSISHQIIVDKHKGWLSCLSTPGVGTEFVIEVPTQPL